MRVNHEMSVMRQRVREKTLDGFGFTGSPGGFLLNGDHVSRRTIVNASSHEIEKIVMCGTCGARLSTSQTVSCRKCKQMEVKEDSFIGTLADDWRRHKVSIQYKPPAHERRLIKRLDETDDLSSVTSGDRSYLEDCDRKYLEAPLSRSDRREPSTHKMPHPGEPEDKYYKFLSGFGMQEPKEKIYSQGERLWLPSRAGHQRSDAIANGRVTLKGSPSKDRTLRQHGPEDKPHWADRSRGSSKSFNLK